MKERSRASGRIRESFEGIHTKSNWVWRGLHTANKQHHRHIATLHIYAAYTHSDVCRRTCTHTHQNRYMITEYAAAFAAEPSGFHVAFSLDIEQQFDISGNSEAWAQARARLHAPIFLYWQNGKYQSPTQQHKKKKESKFFLLDLIWTPWILNGHYDSGKMLLFFFLMKNVS